MSVFRNLIVGALALVSFIVPAAAQGARSSDTFKVALHVDQNDPKTMALALNNVTNVIAELKQSGQKVDIRVVAYGPGLHMLRDDTSPVKARIAEISLAHPNVTFVACGNTQANMAKAENKSIKLIGEAKRVPSGVVHLVQLQQQGFAYVKP